MLKKTLIAVTLCLLVLLGTYAVQSATERIRGSQPSQKTSDAPTGTLQKMIVENGSVTLNLDLNRLNGISSTTQNLQQVRFAVAANSFFPILIFNDLFRGMEPGSMTSVPQSSAALPAGLNASLNRLAVKNFLRVKGSILPCATAIQDSPFSTSKGTSTITTPLRSPLPSPMADCFSRKSLPAHSVAHRMLVRRLERSLSARPCNRSEHPGCQRPRHGDHASHATCSRFWPGTVRVRPGCYCRGPRRREPT